MLPTEEQAAQTIREQLATWRKEGKTDDNIVWLFAYYKANEILKQGDTKDLAHLFLDGCSPCNTIEIATSDMVDTYVDDIVEGSCGWDLFVAWLATTWQPDQED